MSQRKKDVILADKFTKKSHSHATPALDPELNKLTKPINVLIIGASKGIGSGIAYAYAKAGVSTLILASRASSAQEQGTVEQRVKELNPSGRTIGLEVDITTPQSVLDLATRVEKEVDRLDAVVLNSGYSGDVNLRVEDGDPAQFQNVMDVNIQGTYLVAHYFIPLLRKSNGEKQFIVVGSFAACIINGHIANVQYCVSKFAQARLVEFLAENYAAEGICTVAVHPGAVNTEMADKTTPESFRPYLVDDVELCGAFCVWLSREKQMWLNGRLVSATWDVDELLEKRRKIEEQDLLKFGFRVGDASAALSTP